MDWHQREGTAAADEQSGTSAEARLEHSVLLRFDAFLARRSPAFIIILGLLLLALFGLIDAVTGTFDVAPLYIVPIGLVTFSRGRWMGALMALLATFARGAAEVSRGVADVHNMVTYWSGLTRLYVFMAVVLMIGPCAMCSDGSASSRRRSRRRTPTWRR